MRHIFKLDASLEQKPAVVETDGKLVVAVGADAVSIPKSARSNIRIHIDRCQANGKQIEVQGWAFCRDSEQPIKRIYLALDGRIIGSGKPVLRTDVRRVFHLDYDHYGFRIDANTEFDVYPGDSIDLFVMDGGGMIHVPTAISGTRGPAVAATKVALNGEKLFLLHPEATTAEVAGREEFDLVNNIQLHVDRIEISQGRVTVRGWCFDQHLMDARPQVGLVKGDMLMSPLIPCSVKRPDVIEAYSLTSKNPFQGFGFDIHADGLQEDDKQALRVLAVVCADRQQRAMLTNFSHKKVNLLPRGKQIFGILERWWAR
ncbi:hypothetical protein BLJAPNOD_05535 [Ensifer sp. M14]|uniref:hypothetical protein n=1 Tax=Ensifer sp. M14 TaxID=2203782 RepID=UPI000E1E1F64|nr:hypothetical protein [Ensifer sp. M14]RDL47611.1 hypothetical protein BLJAPNOD_05535 [Ensifer sp. M14]